MFAYRVAIFLALSGLCTPLHAMSPSQEKRKIEPTIKHAEQPADLERLRLAIATIIMFNLSEEECTDKEISGHDPCPERQGRRDKWLEESVKTLNESIDSLKMLTFEDLDLSDSFMPPFLKALVLKGENKLLKEFLDMSGRKEFLDMSGRKKKALRSPYGVNFIYGQDGIRKRVGGIRKCIAGIPKHTLLDVAYTKYVVARAEDQPGDIELQVVQSVIDAGGEYYRTLALRNRRPKRPTIAVRLPESAGKHISNQVESPKDEAPVNMVPVVVGAGNITTGLLAHDPIMEGGPTMGDCELAYQWVLNSVINGGIWDGAGIDDNEGSF